jgi:hypothetical protein
MVGRTLVACAALSMCALARAQSTPAPRDSATAPSSKASPSPSGKSVAGGGPDAAAKPELHDIKPQASPPSVPLVLKNAGPMSTEDVARGVARELAKQDAGRTIGQSAEPSSAKPSGGTQSNSKVKTQAPDLALEPASSSDAVMEFQPAPSGSGPASSSGVVHDGAQSKSPLKRVHGDLYGAMGASGHAAGGSVGATSKSGKTSVYIQSDEARSKIGQPQQ